MKAAAHPGQSERAGRAFGEGQLLLVSSIALTVAMVIVLEVIARLP